MSDKKPLVGQAKRNADIEAARKMLTKQAAKASATVTISSPDLLPGVGLVVAKETPNQTMARVLGTKPIEATTENKEVLSDSSKTVVQKQKKATAKKPTAADLGVGQVIGGRGKVTSENPVHLIKPKTAKEVQEDLSEYFKEATHHHGLEGYGICREIERRTGQMWWFYAEKNETIASLMVRAIKSLQDKGPNERFLTPTIKRVETHDAIVVSGPKQTNGIEVTSVRVVAPTVAKVVKPRGDGWNGYSTSAIFRWAGQQGWTKEDCIKCISALGLTGVGVGSLPTLLKAGRDGFRLPEMKPEHAELLNVAAGKVEVKTQVKSK